MEKKPPHVRLRAARLRLKLSEQALAEELGCSQSFISAVERQLQSPGLRLALEIKRFVGIDPAEWVHARVDG